MKIRLSQALKNKLWWLIISVDYDYSRVKIADNFLGETNLILWLEDGHDFKDSIDDCLPLTVSLRDFAKVIEAENLNSYEGTKMHPTKNFVYKTRIQINEPIKWYNEDATLTEQQWARESVIKAVLEQMVEWPVTGLEY